MKRNEDDKIARELYGMLILSLKSIIQEFPLEYNKQRDSINYIIERITNVGSIKENSDYPRLNKEFEEINEIIIGYCKHKKITEKEDQKNIYNTIAELIKDGFLQTINPNDKLEKKYFDKLNQATYPEEKKEIINEYNLEVKAINDKFTQELRDKEKERIGRKIINVEDHILVKEGIVTKEEIEPYISNYELLYALGEHRHLADYNGNFLVKKIFVIARNFYPNNSSQGLKELMELSYEKMTDLLGDNILALLNNKQISFADINYIVSNELGRINDIEIKSDFELLECVIASGCPLTLRKLIEDGKISNFNRKELELVVALFEKDTKTLSSYQGMKLDNEVSKLLLTFVASYNYDLEELLPFMNIKDLGNEIFSIAVRQHKQAIMKEVIEEKIDLSSKNLIEALRVNFDHMEIFRYLLSFEKLNINALDQSGDTILALAIYENNLEIVKQLLSHKDINVNKKNKIGYPPLFQAINQREPKIVKELLSHKDIRLNEKDKHEHTPLHIIAIINNFELFDLIFLHKDIDVNAKNKCGWTALHYAIVHNNLEMVRKLLSWPNININEKMLLDQKNYYNVLEYVILENKPELVKILLSHPDVKASEKMLSECVLKDKPEIAKLLHTYEIIKAQDNFISTFHEELEVSILGTSETENHDN